MNKPIQIFANKYVSIDWLLPIKGDKLGHVEKPSPSVAIVGSSGILLDKEYGKDIDSHDIIMRFNMARVKGFEKHVGSKTDFRMIAGKSFWRDLSENFSSYDNNFLTDLQEEHFLIKAKPMYPAIQGIIKKKIYTCN